MRHDICCDGVAKQDCAKAILAVVNDDWYKNNNVLFEDAMRHLLTNYKDECREMVESYKPYFDDIELVEEKLGAWKTRFLEGVQDSRQVFSFKDGDVYLGEYTHRNVKRNGVAIYEMLKKEIDVLCPSETNPKVNSELKKLVELRDFKINETVTTVFSFKDTTQFYYNDLSLNRSETWRLVF